MTPAPNRRLLAFVSMAMVVDTAAYTAITPLLPGLAHAHHLSSAMAGLVTAAYALGTLVLSLPAACLASRIGAKRTVLGSLGLLAGASLAFGLATSPAALVAARLMQGAGAAAIWAGAMAWLVRSAPPERRVQVIGTALGFAIGGALAGPVLGAAASGLGTGVVFGAFVALPVGLVVVGRRLPGPEPVPTRTTDALRSFVREPRVRRGMWWMALPSAAAGAVAVLVPLRLDADGLGAGAIAAVFLAAVALEAAASPVAGRQADRHGPLRPARVGLLVGGLAFLAVAASPGAVLLSALVIVSAPLVGLLWSPAMAVLTDGTEVRGIDPAFGFGLANMAWGIGAAVGGTAGGALDQAVGGAVPFLLLGVAMLLSADRLRGVMAMPKAV